MGVNYGVTGGRVPQNLEWDANANCPPDFVMFQSFKHRVACITMQYNYCDCDKSNLDHNYTGYIIHYWD